MGVLSDRLGQQGAIVPVKVMLSPARVAAMKRGGLPPTPTRILRGLIDSGASISCMDRGQIAEMGLEFRGSTLIHTPGTDSAYVERNQYDVTFVLGEGQEHVVAMTLLVIGSDFSNEGFDALIGRDILRLCVFVFDGPRETFTLTFEPPAL